MGPFSDPRIEVVSRPTIEELSKKSSVDLVEVLFDRKQKMDDRFDAALALRTQTDKSEDLMSVLFAKVDESTKPLGAGQDPAGEAFQVQKTGKMAAIALQNDWVSAEKIAKKIQDWIEAGVSSNRKETALLQANDMLRQQIEGSSKLWLPATAKKEVPPAYDQEQAREFEEASAKLDRGLTILAGSEADLASRLISQVLLKRMPEDTHRMFALNASAGNDSLIMCNTFILLLTDRHTSGFLREYTLKLLEAYCPNNARFRDRLGEMRDYCAEGANKVIDLRTSSDLTILARRFERIVENVSSPERKHDAIAQFAYNPWRILMHMEHPHGRLSFIPGSNVICETRPPGTMADLILPTTINM